MFVSCGGPDGPAFIDPPEEIIDFPAPPPLDPEQGDKEINLTHNDLGIASGGRGELYVYQEAGNAILNIVYIDPASITSVPLTTDAISALNGKSITVTINGNAGDKTLSLAYVHWLRRALQSAVGAGNVTIDSTSLTPKFDGRDWWAHDGSSETKNLYLAYAAANNNLMEGITVQKASDKYTITYNRNIVVSGVVWQNNEFYGGAGPVAPFNNFGLKKDPSGTVTLSGDAIVSGGSTFEGTNSNHRPVVPGWLAYSSALTTAGLHPSKDKVLLNHSRILVTGLGGSTTNVAHNEMYDFLLAYENAVPSKLDSNTPQWASGLGLTFDGNSPPAGLISTNPRTIKGKSATDSSRKDGDGVPRDTFYDSITGAMMKHMKERLFIVKISDTNVIGDANTLPGYSSGNLDLSTIETVNVGYIGDFSAVNVGMLVNAKGVMDITGAPPVNIGQISNKGGYLNLYGNVIRATTINSFFVVYAHGAGGQYIATDVGNSGDLTKVNQFIFAHKYSVPPTGNAANYKPYYRAFLDNSDGKKPKITGTDFAANYASTDPGRIVYAMDESLWITQGRNGTVPNTGNGLILSSTFSALPAQYKWANEATFNSNVVQ